MTRHALLIGPANVANPAATAMLGLVDLPRGVVRFDTRFGKSVELQHCGVTVAVPVTQAAGDVKLKLCFQGCADEGLCKPLSASEVRVSMSGGRVQQARWRTEVELEREREARAGSVLAGAATSAATRAAGVVALTTCAPAAVVAATGNTAHPDEALWPVRPARRAVL